MRAPFLRSVVPDLVARLLEAGVPALARPTGLATLGHQFFPDDCAATLARNSHAFVAIRSWLRLQRIDIDLFGHRCTHAIIVAIVVLMPKCRRAIVIARVAESQFGESICDDHADLLASLIPSLLVGVGTERAKALLQNNAPQLCRHDHIGQRGSGGLPEVGHRNDRLGITGRGGRLRLRRNAVAAQIIGPVGATGQIGRFLLRHGRNGNEGGGSDKCELDDHGDLSLFGSRLIFSW
jgi:hypothetical protein